MALFRRKINSIVSAVQMKKTWQDNNGTQYPAKSWIVEDGDGNTSVFTQQDFKRDFEAEDKAARGMLQRDK